MEWLVFATFFAACAAAGSTGSMFPPDDWYEQLTKPSWTPPNWLFPLAWTVLYVTMAWAATLVSAAGEGAALGLALWALQIALNAIWTPVFFGLKRLGAAFVALMALWSAVAACVVVFFQIEPLAGWLFLPYLIWVSYAAALNYWIYKHNPDADAAAAGG
ncbi:MAG: TspO/MBR family protein [Pseudomonadota bacterium]